MALGDEPAGRVVVQGQAADDPFAEVRQLVDADAPQLQRQQAVAKLFVNRLRNLRRPINRHVADPVAMDQVEDDVADAARVVDRGNGEMVVTFGGGPDGGLLDGADNAVAQKRDRLFMGALRAGQDEDFPPRLAARLDGNVPDPNKV